MELDASGWTGEGAFTQRLIDAIREMPLVRFIKVEDAPASRTDAGFSFISNEVFIVFALASRVMRSRRLGFIPSSTVVEEKLLSLSGLESLLSVHPDIGQPDYSDEGMLQYLRTERIVPPHQTRGLKLVELVRIYEAGAQSLRASSPDRMSGGAAG